MWSMCVQRVRTWTGELFKVVQHKAVGACAVAASERKREENWLALVHRWIHERHALWNAELHIENNKQQQYITINTLSS